MKILTLASAPARQKSALCLAKLVIVERRRNSIVFTLRPGLMAAFVFPPALKVASLAAKIPFHNHDTESMTLRSLILAATAVTSLAISLPAKAQGNMKVGIVDMKRVFQEYYKTKDAEKKVNEDKSKAKKELDERGTKYKELIGRWNEIEKVLKDKLVNEQLKTQKQKEAQDVISEARSMEREMEEFKRKREQQLQEQVMRMRKGLLEDIKVRVEEKAKRDNFDLVFDKSGMSPSGVPFLLHSKDASDFSTEVISELNKNAPADTAPAAEKEKPAAP